MAPHENTSRKFHISLNVSDLNKSVAFYRVLFDVPPAKCRPDYAKFELEDPAVVLSLEPMRHTPGGALNHLGLRIQNAEALVDVQRRLEAAGISTTREENVECCYARQTKFWCLDPDRNNWELYLISEDLDHKANSPRPGLQTEPAATQIVQDAPASDADRSPVIWEHRLGSPIPDRIPLDSTSADEVSLRGSFNADVSAESVSALFEEAYRVLRPGGRVVAHGLITDRPLDARPSLPGPAAAVQRVPLLDEPLHAAQQAGFVGIHLEKLGVSCCLRQGDIGMREFLLVGARPAKSAFDLQQSVIYRGPMCEVQDDFGNVFRRGAAVSISRAAAEALRHGTLADQFAFLTPGDVPVSQTTEAAHV